jgi:EF hand
VSNQVGSTVIFSAISVLTPSVRGSARPIRPVIWINADRLRAPYGSSGLVEGARLGGPNRTCFQLRYDLGRPFSTLHQGRDIMRMNLVVAATAILCGGVPGAHAAGSTMYGSVGSEHLLHQMDANQNGTVSKREFLQYIGQKFERLDTNRNGRLERHELRPLVGGGWDHTPHR